jgi:autotransporter-associated beta strand protein
MLFRRDVLLVLAAAIVGSSVSSSFVSTAHAFEVIDRWTSTATNGPTGSQGTPVTLTWSLVPDGTQVPADVGGYASSDLIGFLDGLIGAGPGGSDYTQRPWFPYLEQSYQRLSEVAGITFVYESHDDGIRHDGSASTNGALGVRGDMRIGTSLFPDDSSTLAFNYYSSYGGDMVINPNQGMYFGDPDDGFRVFRNIIMHETMHGLGIFHVESADADFLIEPILSDAFDGPQLDDILALQRNYGDVHEKGAGNNSAATATPLGTLTAAPRSIGSLGANTVVDALDLDFLSIDDDSDTDFFSFTVTQRSDVTLDVTPIGTTYDVGPQGGQEFPLNTKELNNLALALLGTNGVTVLSTTNANGVGLAESLSYQLDPGTYYARVRGTLNDIQLYGLTVTAAPAAAGTLVWKGDASNAWDVGVTANFVSNAAPAKFFTDMAVEFDDTAASFNVELAQNVAPFSTMITTAAEYKISGPGGIVTGDLTIDGGGEVELANSSNEYEGPTTIKSGTLRITGNANEMVSPIEVKSGAKLVLDSIDAGTMDSPITIREGAELQVGTATTTSNTLADVHPGIVNQGTMRVLDAEEINHVTGNGAVVLESETSTISDNLGFDGPLTVRSGAGVRALNAAAFGSNFGATTIENGASLAFDGNVATGEPISLAGTGGGQGALRVEAGRQVTLSGAVSVTEDSTRIQLQEGATLSIANGLDASATATPLELATAAGSQLNVASGLQAAAGLVKSGAGNATISGNIVLAGTIDVDAGKLTLAGPTQLDSHFDIAPGATLAISGAHTFGSEARLTGTGLVQGTFNFPGSIAPGASAGGMAVAGNLALSGKLEIEIGGTTPLIDYDQLHIIGAGVLGGLAQVSLINDYVPSFGDAFTILTGTKPLTGEFDGLMLPNLGGGLGWNVSYLTNSVRLSVTSIGLTVPADFNSDGSVNSGDLNVWRNNFGVAANANRNQGDADGDGAITGADFLIWQRQASAAGSAGVAAAVPEPAAWGMALVALAPFAARLRRR